MRDLRANVKDIEHERAFLLGNVGTTQPIITMETRDFDHVREIVDMLKIAPACIFMPLANCEARECSPHARMQFVL